MKREDRLSAGMTSEKVSEVYAILKERFDERRKRLQEIESQRKAVIPSGEKQ
nr:MAG TPA: Pre-mRNA-splicing factor 8, U4/U6 small, assembly, pre-B complex, U1 [Caudoviricetes sp.]